jgi:TonB family protein
MMTQNRQNKFLAVCAAIGLHALAFALLFFSLPGNARMLPDMGKLNFMWVTLGEKSGQAFVFAQKNTKPLPAAAPPALAPEINPTPHRRDQTEAPAFSGDVTLNNQSFESSDGDEVSLRGNSAQHHAQGKTPSNGAGGDQAPGAEGGTGRTTKAQPLYRENPPPGYPEMARHRGYEGVVLVEAEILTDGRVGQAAVRKSSGYAILDQAAVRAVKGWKFEPARKSGIPQKTMAELPIRFVLNDNNSQL